MGKLTAGAVVLDVDVMDSTQLSNRNESIAHQPIGGGLPDITLRDSSGLSGTLELVCRDAATADAVYAAHLNGQVLRLDNWQRQNLVKDPRLTAATWSQNGSTGTLTHEVAGGPNGHGFFQYAMATANTTSPMVIPLAPVGTGGIPVVPGEPIIVSAYWYQTINQNVQRYNTSWYDAAGVVISTDQGEDEIVVGEPPATWYRELQVFTPPALARFARPVMNWSGTFNVPQTLRVADALVEYGTVLRDWFDGSSPDTATTDHRWDGAVNNSVSRQYLRPALAFTYVCVAGGPEIPHLRDGLWTVRVSGIQEVAP